MCNTWHGQVCSTLHCVMTITHFSFQALTNSTSWQGCTYDNVVGLKIMIFTASSKMTSFPVDINSLLWPQILLRKARRSFLAVRNFDFFTGDNYQRCLVLLSLGSSDQRWQLLELKWWPWAQSLREMNVAQMAGTAAILSPPVITWPRSLP